jgi:hypothetical protein
MSAQDRAPDRIDIAGFSSAEREAYAELAEVAAQWQRTSRWERERRVRAERAVRRAIAQAPRVNGRPLKLTDTWPGVPMPPASNDEPIPLVTVRKLKRDRPPASWRRLLSSLTRGCRSGGT